MDVQRKLQDAIHEYERHYGRPPDKLYLGCELWDTLRAELPGDPDPHDVLTYYGYEVMRCRKIEPAAVAILAPLLWFSPENLKHVMKPDWQGLRDAFGRESPFWKVMQGYDRGQSGRAAGLHADDSAAGAERDLESDNRRDANGCSAENNQG